MERDTFLSDNGSALLNKPFRLHPLLRTRSSLRDSTSRVPSVLSLQSFKIKKIPARINPTTRETLRRTRNSQKISSLESQGFKLRLPTSSSSSTTPRLHRKDFKRSIPGDPRLLPYPKLSTSSRGQSWQSICSSPDLLWTLVGRPMSTFNHGARLSWTGSTGRTAKMPRPTINYPRGSVARALNLT